MRHTKIHYLIIVGWRHHFSPSVCLLTSVTLNSAPSEKSKIKSSAGPKLNWYVTEAGTQKLYSYNHSYSLPLQHI